MGKITVSTDVEIYYAEYGSGDSYILSAQVGFAPKGMQQKLAEMGYHVICITLRGFAPSSYITEDYGAEWYDVFAEDVVRVADALGIEKFAYMGASHGAGLGWHLMLNHPERVSAFVAVVPGPHSLKEGTMSFRQMMMQGIIDAPPPFNPPIDDDAARELRRARRAAWLSQLPEADPRERAIDYGRPLMKYKNEETLCEKLRSIKTPTLIIGGADDPISTPELMMRTAKCLPHCKLVMYSNCGHDIDTDIIEEVCDEADRFLRQTERTGRCYIPVDEA
ncbi:MAG: alpha/beta hydrolase [Lachnospiraceae bacterium]|nr:alpha/beta hydrolase [Lachnospiraceae bacterium]MBQ9513142.1 alpha/beta hydrolase [Lachnospiraceae bacterium]